MVIMNLLRASRSSLLYCPSVVLALNLDSYYQGNSSEASDDR